MANNDAEMTLLKKTTIDEKIPKRKMEPIDAKFYLRKRYLVMILMPLCYALSVVLRANLSIVIMDIAYPKYILQGNRTIYQKPLVDWNSKQVGFIIGAITYGQVPGIIIAGLSAKKYGGATLFGGGLLVSSMFACLTPAVLNASYLWLFVIVRIVEGFGAGLLEGSYCDNCLNWSIVEERARYTSTLSMSIAFGIILSNVVTGYGIYYFNWQTVFFATGGTGIILAILWLLFVRNRPCDDKFMSKIERRFLMAKIQSTSEKDATILSYPWRKILTSLPVWAYLNEYFCCGWSTSFIIYCLPLYIKDVTKSDIKSVSVMSSIPWLCTIISEIIFSYTHDRILRSYCIKKKSSNIHRIILSASHLGVAISLVAMALWVNFEASLILISFLRTLLGIKHVYYNVMAIDVFYRYAGFVRSLASISLLLTNCLTPLLIGIIVTNHERSQWSIFFGIIVVFNIFSVFIFCRYGSFDLQSWAAAPAVDNEEKTCSS